MKYSPIVKIFAILLAAVCLIATLASAGGIIGLISQDLYSQTLDDMLDDRYYAIRWYFATDLLTEYAALELGDFPEKYLPEYFPANRFYEDRIRDGYYAYIIYDETGKAVASTHKEEEEYASVWEIGGESVAYPSTLIPPGETADTYVFFDEDLQEYVEVMCVRRTLQGYTLRLYLKENPYHLDTWGQLMTVLYGIRYWLFGVFGLSFLLTALLCIYLWKAAGASSDGQVRPRGLSRLPLDLYSGICLALAAVGIALTAYLIDQILDQAPQLLIFLASFAMLLACLILVSLYMAWAAQIKMKEFYWLKNSLVGRLFSLLLRGMGWLGKKLGHLVKSAGRLYKLLPMIWQWLVVLGLMVLCPFVCLLSVYSCSYRWESFWILLFFLSVLVDALILLYVPVCFGILYRGVKKLRQGDLNARISTQYLLGPFRDFALELNNLSETVALAAQNQMRSERMKAELVTNVSHDIKTPLTSIINFVDLLQKPHTDQQREEYLAVLARQSAQMKKLIEDLTELSKATTGNITVCAQKMDAVEAVNQALGEFSDKLDAAGLIPVFRSPEEPVYIHADGRLVWRVLFNLLTNAVKYAMPGTRLYVTLTKCDDRVALSLKNVSREELRLSAEDLLERFVQGDASRNAEGSGLGLNIAKGLMESQQGTLSLLLDGDLFKVTLTFPAAE